MKVYVSLGRTVNIGNFESIRLDYGIELTSKEGETSQQCYDRAQKVVEGRLNLEVSKIEKRLKG